MKTFFFYPIFLCRIEDTEDDHFHPIVILDLKPCGTDGVGKPRLARIQSRKFLPFLPDFRLGQFHGGIYRHRSLGDYLLLFGQRFY